MRDLPKYTEKQVSSGRGERCAWGLTDTQNSWLYWETDGKGEICDRKKFPNEYSAVVYAREILENRIREAEHCTPYDRAVKYIQEEYGYSGAESARLVDKIFACPDIVGEFLEYICMGEYCRKGAAEIHGYTAEVLDRKYGFPPLDAYIMMTYLKKEPELLGWHEASLAEKVEKLERQISENEAMMRSMEVLMDRLKKQMELLGEKKCNSCINPASENRAWMVQSCIRGSLTWDSKEGESEYISRAERKAAEKMLKIQRGYDRIKKRREKIAGETEELREKYKKMSGEIN